MKEFERNHYIQNRLLRNFATVAVNGKYKICLLNLIEFSAKYRNTDRAFYLKNFYDVKSSEDVKDLEKKFNDKIESMIVPILTKFLGNDEFFEFTRNDLGIIKKYILLQLYRTPHNQKSYTNIPSNSFELSQFNIKENESKENFWKREMLTILDTDWEKLLCSNMIGIRKHAMEINSNFIMFVRTNEEFCINDLGYSTERISINISKAKEENYIKLAKKIGKELYGQNNFDELAKKEIENKNIYIDNFILFPVSSNLVILSVSPLWKMLYLHPELLNSEIPFVSGVLTKHFSIPIVDYVNKEKIKIESDIQLYKDGNDKFKYKVHTLTREETTYLNHLIMNEAFAYIGLKTPSKFLETIKQYNIMAGVGSGNIKKNLLGFVELLSKLGDLPANAN